jgi:hypothetical protein
MPHPSHPPWLDYSYTWQTVEVMKLLIMQFSRGMILLSLKTTQIIKLFKYRHHMNTDTHDRNMAIQNYMCWHVFRILCVLNDREEHFFSCCEYNTGITGKLILPPVYKLYLQTMIHYRHHRNMTALNYICADCVFGLLCIQNDRGEHPFSCGERNTHRR